MHLRFEFHENSRIKVAGNLKTNNLVYASDFPAKTRTKPKPETRKSEQKNVKKFSRMALRNLP